MPHSINKHFKQPSKMFIVNAIKLAYKIFVLLAYHLILSCKIILENLISQLGKILAKFFT